MTILKLVYWFGIPNSGPKTLKSLKINSSKNRQMTIHPLVPPQGALSVLSYSECKIAKMFGGFVPGPHRRGLTVPPQTP